MLHSAHLFHNISPSSTITTPIERKNTNGNWGCDILYDSQEFRIWEVGLIHGSAFRGYVHVAIEKKFQFRVTIVKILDLKVKKVNVDYSFGSRRKEHLFRTALFHVEVTTSWTDRWTLYNFITHEKYSSNKKISPCPLFE